MRFLTLTVFATILSAPAFAADIGTYRPGTSYNSAIASGADVCDSQCAGDAQCRGWNYVKPNPQAPGICEYLSSVSTPISSQISISGENITASPYSSQITSGGTNTVRVGTQVSTGGNTVKVGQTPSTRRIVRQAPPQRVTTQNVSTKPVEHMSLTEQQNRYRQAQTPQAQMPQSQTSGQTAAARPQVGQTNRQAMPVHGQMFRPILDAPMSHQAPQHAYNPAMPQQNTMQLQNPNSRRMTGPRRPVAQPPVYGMHQPASQPYGQYGPQHQAAYSRNPMPAQRQNMGGQSRPPIGQPIPAPQSPSAAQPVMRPGIPNPSQRLAQFTAQTRAHTPAPNPAAQGPMALTPQQAQQSLFGRLNDDVQAAQPMPGEMPVVNAVPTAPVTQQPLGEVLAGGR